MSSQTASLIRRSIDRLPAEMIEGFGTLSPTTLAEMPEQLHARFSGSKARHGFSRVMDRAEPWMRGDGALSPPRSPLRWAPAPAAWWFRPIVIARSDRS
jgi:hypothetical protein